MGRIPRPGDVLIALVVALLIAATVNELESFADAHERRAADQAAFAGYTHVQPGRANVRITRHHRWDVVCSQRLCVRVRTGPAGTRVVWAHPRSRQ